MISQTQETAGVKKPPSRLSAYGLSQVDWALTVAGAAMGAIAVASLFQLSEADVTGVLARLVAPVGLLLVGLALFRAVRSLERTERRAWTVVAGGIVVYAAGAATRSIDSLRILEVPPRVSPLIFMAATVAAAFGIAWLPRLNPTSHSIHRAFMDGSAGAAAVGALLWELVRPAVDPRVPGDWLLNAGVVFGSAVLVGATMFTLMRQERYRFDRPFRLMMGAVVAIAVSGTTSAAGTGPVFELRWPVVADLLAAVAIAAVAVELARTRQVRNSTVARLPPWKLAVPYTPVMVFVAVTFYGLSTDPSDIGILPFALVAVTIATGFSQMFAARENRALVGIERDQLISAVSHELRVPLTAVAGFSDVLSVGSDLIEESERNEMVEIIQTQSRYLTGMITDMSSLVRDQLHSVDLEVTRLDGKKLIADAVRSVFDLNVGPLPVKAQVEPYLEIMGDSQRLQQLLVSLLKNAQRYGGGRILVVGKRDADWRILEVHDDGPGLPSRHERVVWDRFQRGENELNAQLPGSGLGLAMVRSLAIAHGGTAHYERSIKLGGACFVVRLPMETAADVARERLDPV